MRDNCSDHTNDDPSANTTSPQSPSSSKSTTAAATLASIKSSFIAKVNQATAVRRQRSAVDASTDDVTSDGPSDLGGWRPDAAAAAVGGGGLEPGARRRRLRSPFSSARLSSEPKKASRSSLAEQRIIESVVFRPPMTSTVQVGLPKLWYA